MTIASPTSGIGSLFKTSIPSVQYANLTTQNSNLNTPDLTTTQVQALNTTAIQALNTAPTDLLGSAQGSTSTLLNAAASAIYQPLDGVTAAGPVQGPGLASVAAGLAAAGYASVAAAQAANATVNQIFPPGYLTQKGSAKTFDLNTTPTQTDDVVAPSNLSPSTFEQWSTGYQKQYIAFWSSAYAADRSKGLPDFQIGSNTGNTIDVVVTPSIAQSGPNKGTALPESAIQVIIVQALTKTSVATLSQDEQTLVAENNAFSAPPSTPGAAPNVATALGLSINTAIVKTLPTGATASNSGANIAAAITQIAQQAASAGVPIDNLGNYTGPANQQATYNSKNDGRPLNYSDVDVFIQELNELLTQVNQTPLVSDDSVTAKIQAIADRAQTAILFGSVPNQVSAAAVGPGGPGYHDSNGSIDDVTNLTQNVVSTDVAATTANTTQVFLHVLEPHDGADTSRIPADGLVTSSDLTDHTDSIFNLLSDPTNPNSPPLYKKNSDGYLWLIDPDGTRRELKPGTVVQVDANGCLVGKVEDDTGKVITALLSPANTIQGYFNPRASQQLLAQNYTGPIMSLDGSSILTTAIPHATWPTGKGTIPGFESSTPVIETVNLPVTTAGAASNQTTTSGGYQKMMQAERQILGLKNQMDSVAGSDTLGTKSLDVPSLIFFMQLYTNQIDEQEINASTEVVNQLNDLLNTYSQMQNLVNAVQTKFTAGNQTEQRDIFGNLVNGSGNVTDFWANQLLSPSIVDATGKPTTNPPTPLKDSKGNPVQVAPNGQASMNILSMFDKILGSGAQNPIEAKFQITRPLQTMVDLGSNGKSGSGKTVGYTATAWNAFATSLSSTVTQLNQQVQILMNNINSLDKEKDQHYDLANNTASSMSQLLTTISHNLN